jgi:alpha-beta hydrolase superfamily lysophospholipase
MSTQAASQQIVRIPSFDGTMLYGRHWPGTNSRGTLVISHGMGEHSGCYDEFASTVTAIPGLVDVVGFDYRGHGLSPGKRGVIRSYEDLVADLDAVTKWAATTWPRRPVFLLGHSNGGQVALREILEGGKKIRGLILSNPSLKLALDVPAWKLIVGHVLRRVAPQVTLSSPLLTEQMTRDASMYPAREADTLRHARVSAPLFFGMVEGGPIVLARAAEIHLPTLMILGGADAVVDSATSRQLFDHLGSTDKTLRLFPEMYHEPLNDLGRENVYAILIAWLQAHLTPLA